jgi:hypothetical protein
VEGKNTLIPSFFNADSKSGGMGKMVQIERNNAFQGKFKACTSILLREIELLEKIPPLQVLIRDAVLNREWADYEYLMESIGKIGVQFEGLEEEREGIFSEFSEAILGTEKDRFYALASRLPERERNELTDLYRRLKMETLQIKLTNDSLMEYLQEAKSAVNGLLENAYPDRRGKIYSKEGISREAEMKSIVLNHSF